MFYSHESERVPIDRVYFGYVILIRIAVLTSREGGLATVWHGSLLAIFLWLMMPG